MSIAGGKVLGATTLMAGPFSHILAPTRTTLERLRDKLPQLEPWWKATYGHGFEGLTDSEAKYLASLNSTDAIRDRLAAGARSPAKRRNPGDPEGPGEIGGAGAIKGDTE
jgi:hypothetical protein